MISARALRVAAVMLAIAAIGSPSVAIAKRHPHAPVVTELATFAAPGCDGGCGDSRSRAESSAAPARRSLGRCDGGRRPWAVLPSVGPEDR